LQKAPSKRFLATIARVGKSSSLPRNRQSSGRGNAADAVFYIEAGKVRVTVVSPTGKGATLAILSEGEFFGEGSLAGQALRTGSATAMKDGKLMRIDKNAMMPSRWNTRRLRNTRFRNE
jgi:CRP/FNR family transcriptional regulator, cyclic AMP receptor protein